MRVSQLVLCLLGFSCLIWAELIPQSALAKGTLKKGISAQEKAAHCGKKLESYEADLRGLRQQSGKKNEMEIVLKILALETAITKWKACFREQSDLARRQGTQEAALQDWHPGSTRLSQTLYDTRIKLHETDVEYDALVKKRSRLPIEQQAELKTNREIYRVQIKDFLAAILDSPHELDAYLRDHGRNRGNLQELIENKEGVKPGPHLTSRLICLALLAKLSDHAAIRALENNFPENSWDSLSQAKGDARLDGIRSELQRLLTEARDPSQKSRRVILRRNAESVVGSRLTEDGFTSGSESESGWLLAEEGAMHYDMIHEGVVTSYVHPTPISARVMVDGSLNSSAFIDFAAHASEEFARGKIIATGVVGSGSHWVTLVVSRHDSSIRVLDSMQSTHYFSVTELGQIVDVFKNLGVFPGSNAVKTEQIVTGQQRDGHNCMIFALLNAHQVAKKSDLNAYQEVTHALVSGKLNKYEDINKIGDSNERVEIPQFVYVSETYHPFMNSFRQKTQQLIQEWSH